MRTQSKIRCAGCKERIPPSEPDFMLKDLLTGKRRFYHRRCEEAMFSRIAQAPAAYYWCFRHVDAEAN
jgi:hypothetical protein